MNKEQDAPSADVDITNPISKVWISPSKLDILVGGVDFRLNVLGEVEWLDQEAKC